MSSSDDEFLKELQAAFQVEADEHIQVMSDGLLELENVATPQERQPILERVYREAHSLKGAARAVNMTDIETVCQAVETVFSDWKRQETPPNQAAFNAVHHAVTLITELLTAFRQGGPAPDRRRILETTQQLSSPEQSSPKSVAVPNVTPLPESAAAVPVERRPATETVRIATDKLDELLLQTEEMLLVKLTATQRASELRNAEDLLELWAKEWGQVLPELRLARQEQEQDDEGEAHLPQRLLEFLEESHVYFKSLETAILTLTRAAERDGREISGKVDGLLENTKKLLMLPFSTILGTFPKMVRDLTHDQGKDIQLVIEGGDVEMDKRILEALKDPLLHLLRNSIDHGIETPNERRALQKPPRATVSIAVSQTGGNEVEILVADDGAGIDPARVKSAAVKHGVISANEADGMSDADAVMLIFQSDVSTSALITEISGRGLGMAIVREKVEEAGGRITLETEIHRGTTFRLTLPLTLATFKGILIKSGGDIFVIPTASVERVDRICADDIRTVENRETIVHEGRVLPLAPLDAVLGLPRHSGAAPDTDYSPVIILGTAEKRVAFRIDAVLNEQEVLVKNLGKPLVRVRNVSGATVLGSGKPVPILNAADLIKSAARVAAASTPVADASESAPTAHKASILVAEDSITSRMLLKNILESAGYQVTTAVDGMDALTAFRAQSFDLVVSDVDMPRLSGFDLTARIRKEPTRSDTPLILVTARDTREDRERGVDVGASAYLVKSSFDQSNLLAAVRRLI
ncbi:MAG: response regulator [Armatimonadota bacterium]|nr:response regulator [Armatimonadota bacterium]